jgi:hypothetical protein
MESRSGDDVLTSWTSQNGTFVAAGSLKSDDFEIAQRGRGRSTPVRGSNC